MAERIEYLDGLRGIAAFMVFLGHYIPLYIRVAFLITFAFIIRDFSVCIFFVLSGFVLTFSFFFTANHEKLVSGAVRRYIRLLIPILFLLSVTYALIYPGPSNLIDLYSLKEMLSEGFWGVFLQGQTAYAPEVREYTGVLWTITIEFIGSFLVFSFAALFGQLRNRWILYLAAIVLFLNTYYLAFILGMLLADIFANRSNHLMRWKNPWVLTIGLLIILILVLTPFVFFTESITYPDINSLSAAVISANPLANTMLFQYGGNISGTTLFHIVSAFFLLAVLVNFEWLKSVLSHRIPAFLGRISFSLYLFHMIVIAEFSSFLLITLFDGPVNTLNGIITLLMTIPFLFGVSYLIYRFVDRPGILFAKGIYKRYFCQKSSCM